MLTFISHSLSESQEIGKKLAQELYPGVNILFYGEMGSGKTHIIQSFLKERGVGEDNFSSPTYTLAHYYQSNREDIVHYDLYRLEKNIESIGLDENFFDKSATVLIEWSERLEELPHQRVEVKIKKIAETHREISIDFIGYTLKESELQKLIQHYRIPLHVQKHVAAVTKVALDCTDTLINRGKILHKELLRQAALLHDLVRYIDFKGGLDKKNFPYPVDEKTWKFWETMRDKHQGKHHADVVAEILEQKGYSFIGKVILAHKSKAIFTGFKNTSEKILHYADKRCKHDIIVPLQERITDLKNRYWEYHPDEAYWKDVEKRNIELEKELT